MENGSHMTSDGIWYPCCVHCFYELGGWEEGEVCVDNKNNKGRGHTQPCPEDGCVASWMTL